jgi:hypothetical protein
MIFRRVLPKGEREKTPGGQLVLRVRRSTGPLSKLTCKEIVASVGVKVSISRLPRRSTQLCMTFEVKSGRTTSPCFLRRLANCMSMSSQLRQKPGSILWGGDVRYLMTSDGATIVEKRQRARLLREAITRMF